VSQAASAECVSFFFFQQRQEGVRVVGRISRLVPEKDPETFVRAAALLAHQDKLVFQCVV